MPAERKMILFVMPLPPPIHGVAVMSEIIRKSELLNTTLVCDYIDSGVSKRLSDIWQQSFFKYLKVGRILFTLITKLARRRYDGVYVTLFPFGPGFLKDSFFILAVKLFGCRPVLHLHTFGFKASTQTVFRRKYYRMVFRNCDVICLSKLLIDDVNGLCGGKIFILPNGIPVTNYSNEHDARGTTGKLLFLSNLIKGKGILLLLEALEILKHRAVKFHLRIVGEEADIKYSTIFDLIKEKDLQEMVTVVGPKYGEAKFDELRKTGILVLPTDYDTFGLVLLEAMQYGVPCISTRVGAIPEILGNGRGILLNDLTATVLADEINRLTSDVEKRNRISNEAFQYFTAHYTEKSFEKGLLEILTNQVRTDHLQHNGEDRQLCE